MKNRLLGFSLLIFSLTTFAQGEVSDEFEIQEPAVEINSSKESIKPEDPMGEAINETPLVPESSNKNTEKNVEPSFDLTTMPEATPTPSQEEEGTVLVRERNEEKAPANPNELVELRTPQDVFLPYKQRQNQWGFLFSAGAEQCMFPGYLTQVGIANGDDYTFEDLFGKNGVNMFSVEMGPKFNTQMGSFGFLFGYGSIFAKSSHVGSMTKFSMQRYSASIAYFLDMLFTEPYFIPYVAGGMWQADMRETSATYPDEVGKYSSKPGTQYRFGALFGLDWIEGDASRVSRRQNGTQGTFLNVYAITTKMSESNPDPDLSSEMDLGASLVIEF